MPRGSRKGNKMKSVRREKEKKNTELAKIKRKSALFLAPSVIGVSLFFVLPFMVVIFYSVVNNPIHQYESILRFLDVDRWKEFRHNSNLLQQLLFL